MAQPIEVAGGSGPIGQSTILEIPLSARPLRDAIASLLQTAGLPVPKPVLDDILETAAGPFPPAVEAKFDIQGDPDDLDDLDPVTIELNGEPKLTGKHGIVVAGFGAKLEADVLATRDIEVRPCILSDDFDEWLEEGGAAWMEYADALSQWHALVSAGESPGGPPPRPPADDPGPIPTNGSRKCRRFELVWYVYMAEPVAIRIRLQYSTFWVCTPCKDT